MYGEENFEFNVAVTGAELKTHFAARAAYHTAKSVDYDNKAAVVAKLQDAPEMNQAGLNAGTVSVQYTTFKDKARSHKTAASRFAFFEAHVDVTDTFYFKTSELQNLELIE